MKRSPSILRVGQCVNGKFAVAIVGILPIIEDGIDPEAECRAVRNPVVAYNVVVGAMDVQNTDRRDGCFGGICSRDQSADRCAGSDTVTMLNSHAISHKTAPGEACEKHAVGVELIFHRQRIEKRHQEAGVINRAAQQSRIPHSAENALGEGLWYHNRPTEILG